MLSHYIYVTARIPNEGGAGKGKRYQRVSLPGLPIFYHDIDFSFLLYSQVIYLDTEGNFRPERIESIAERFGLDPGDAYLDT